MSDQNSPTSTVPLIDHNSTVVLISSDQERITVDSKRLSAQSKMFEDLSNSSGDGNNEIAVSESKAMLDAFLPYCGQGKLAPFDLEQPLAWQLVKAFDKYDIGRGFDAVSAAIELARERGKKSNSCTYLIIDYFEKLNFDTSNVDSAVWAIIEYSEPALFATAFARFTAKEGVSDGGKLAGLLMKRELTLATKRNKELAMKMSNNFSVAQGGQQMSFNAVGKVYELWNKSANCASIAQLEEFMLQNVITGFPGSAFVPWRELKEVLAALPTALE